MGISRSEWELYHIFVAGATIFVKFAVQLVPSADIINLSGPYFFITGNTKIPRFCPKADEVFSVLLFYFPIVLTCKIPQRSLHTLRPTWGMDWQGTGE